MKKIVSLLLIAVLALSMGLLSTTAASSFDALAKKVAPTVDGVVGDGEYGNPVVMDSFATSWTNTTLGYDVKYYFAWTADGLYVAVSAPAASITLGKYTPQLNFNPGDLIAEDKAGLFLSMTSKADGSVDFLQHNWGTALNDKAEAGGVSITSLLTYKAVKGDTDYVIEVLLPLSFFQLKGEYDGSAITFSDNTIITASPFAVIDTQGYALIDGKIDKWTVGDLGLGSITLEGEPKATEAPTSAPTEAPTATATTKPATEEKSSNGAITAVIIILIVVVVGVVIFLVIKKKK